MSLRVLTVYLLLALSLSACGDSGPAAPEPERVVAVEIAVDSLTLLEDDSARVEVRVRTDRGNTADTLVVWQSLAPDIAQVSARGQVRGLAPGTAQVVARVGALADTLRVRVVARPQDLVPVSGDAQTGRPGAALPQPLVVRVVDRRGGGVPGVEVRFETTSGGGQLSPAAVLTDSAGFARSTWTLGPTAGEQTAQASALGKVVRFRAVAQLVASRVDVEPDSATLRVGDQVRLRATAYASSGEVVPTAIQWTSRQPEVATVDTGVVRARAAGQTWIVAQTASGARDSARIVVLAASTPPPPAPSCSPTTARSLSVGQVLQFRGSEAASLCLAAGEYVAIPFFASQSSSARLNVSVEASGITGVTGPPSPSRAGTSTSTLSGPRPDAGWEARFRQRELRELTPLLRRLRDRTAPEPRFTRSSSVPQVGDRLQLNTSARCDAPRYTTGRVVAISNRAIVVADTANPAGGFTDADYQSVAAAVDTLIYPVNVENFGAPTDLDQNGRIIVFYTRAVNQLTAPGSEGFVGGFFWAGDLFPRAQCQGSNHAEMFYLLAPDPQGQAGNSFSRDFVFRTTLNTVGHELQHLINAARRIYVNGATSLEVVWLNEALSHIAEELMFYRVTPYQPRQNLGADQVRASQQTVDAANRFMVSNLARYRNYLQNPDTVSLLGVDDLPTRGASWAFLRYAADREPGTDQSFFFRLVNTTATGLANLQQATQADPLAWMQDWSVSVYADDAVPGTAPAYQQPSWNFRSVIPLLGSGFPLRVTPLTNASQTFTLRAGGAIFLRFAVPTATAGTLRWTAAGAALPAEVRISLQRTR